MAAMFPSSGVSYPRSFPCLKRSGKNKKGKSIPCLFLISIMLTDYDVIKNRYGVRTKLYKNEIKEGGTGAVLPAPAWVDDVSNRVLS